MKTSLLESLFNNLADLKINYKDTPAQLFSCEFCAIFQKPYLQKTSRWLILLIPLFQPKYYSLITLCLFFPFFFYYWWLQLWTLLRNCLKTTIFLLFPIVYSKINMLLRKLRLGNNLPTHIKENTNFLRQKPRQLPSAEAVFERCYFRRGQVKRPNNPLSFTALAVLTIIL